MEPFVEEITAQNQGEKEAKLSYIIKEITILGVTYSTDDGVTTSQNLADKLTSGEYPFLITIEMSNGGVLVPEIGVSTITISLVWPFEQGDDELDTYWGSLAFEYYKEHEEDPEIPPSISIVLELRATQVQ